MSEAIDLIGQYQDAGIDLLINGDRNDEEARELFASDVMPHLAKGTTFTDDRLPCPSPAALASLIYHHSSPYSKCRR